MKYIAIPFCRQTNFEHKNLTLVCKISRCKSPRYDYYANTVIGIKIRKSKMFCGLDRHKEETKLKITMKVGVSRLSGM